MVVEILSESNIRHDTIRKFTIYLEAGVREYWIVNPDSRVVEVYLLERGQYIAKKYDDTATVQVSVIEGCEINLAEVFHGLLVGTLDNVERSGGPTVFIEE